MYSTKQEFAKKIKEYLSRKPISSFDSTQFYNRRPAILPSQDVADEPVNFSTQKYLDKRGNEIEIPAISWTFNHKYRDEEYDSVKNNEVHILANIANVADVFVHNDDLKGDQIVEILKLAFNLKKTLSNERQKLLSYLQDDDRALFYKHLLSFALSPDDGKKEFLEKKFEFCLNALSVELKKEFLQYCNIEENIAHLIADETKLDEEQKIQISKQSQSLGVFKIVKRSFINTSIIESDPSSQFQNLQGQALRDSESNSRVLE